MTDTLIVNQREVRRLLPMDKCIVLMRQALEALVRGDAVQPQRSAIEQQLSTAVAIGGRSHETG